MQAVIESTFFANSLYVIVIFVAALAVSSGLNKSISFLALKFNVPALGGKPFRQFLRYGIFIIAVLVALDRFGFDTKSILVVISTLFGLIAIGFVAVWSVLSNFLCALVLMVFKPFRVGDQVSLPSENISGTVRDIELLFTVLENSEGEYINIPNNLFFQKIFKKKSNNML